MEVQISSGRGMPGGAADRDDGVQNPAGALGQRADPDGQENSAQGIQEQGPVPGEGGSVLSPEREPELSADDCPFNAAHASDDYSLVRRLVPAAGNRPAALSGVHIFYLQ